MLERRKIRAREVIDDIRAGSTAFELMKKYRLSSTGLRRIFRKLVDTGSMSREELERHSALYHSDSGDIKGLRRVARKRIAFQLPIYDGGDPFRRGRVVDVSEKGVCVEGIETNVGETKTFIVRFGGLSQGSFVFEGKCKWVNHDAQDPSKFTAGFEITGISNLDLQQLRRLLLA